MDDIQSNFDIPSDKCRTILLIADRVMSLLEPEVLRKVSAEVLPDVTHTQLQMNLESVLLTCPNIDLEKTLDFDDFNFAHNLLGILAHLDRTDYPADLTHCFLPRCAEYGKIADHP